MADQKSEDPGKKKNVSTRSVKKKKDAKSKKCDANNYTRSKLPGDKDKKKKKLALFSLFSKDKDKDKEKPPPKSKADKSMLKSSASVDSDAPSKHTYREAPSAAPSKFETAKLPDFSPEAEQSAFTFLKQLEGLTSDQCSTEYGQVTSVAASAFSPEGTLLTSNDPKVPCIEETRVKVENVTQPFYHANKLTFEKDKDREWIIAQPPKDNPEAFWRLVFQEQAPMVVVLGAAFESGKKQFDEFFCAKILNQMNKLEPGPIVSVSASGTGRSCVVAAVSLLSARICAGNYTNVVDLAVGMRKQRANALPDKLHYASIYSILGTYLMTRLKDKSKWEPALTRYKETVAPGVKS